MAKLFYTLEEAAEKLGVSTVELQELSDGGKLTPYIDRDKKMFKRADVDALVASNLDDSSMELAAETGEDDDAPIELADGSDGSGAGMDAEGDSDGSMGLGTGALDLADDGIGSGTLELDLDSDDSGELEASPDAVKPSASDDTASMELDLDEEEPDVNSASRITLSETSELDADDVALSGTGALDVTRGDALDATGELSVGDLDLADDDADADAFSLEDSDSETEAEDARQATGISVFDADEIDAADPMAQTVVTDSVDDDELQLDSVGSGSGLLDLTRESDDTSLGAELLDEIYPSEGGDTQMVESAAGGSAVFDGTGRASGDSGETVAEATGFGTGILPDMPASGPASEPADAGYDGPVAVEVVDGPGSGLVGGLLAGSFATLVVLLIVMVATITDTPSAITAAMVEDTTKYAIYLSIMGAGSIVLGVVGLIIGKLVSK